MKYRSKCVNLALQGGGSHGAFTWGVLDQLLAGSELTFEAVSGTSSGAVNAVVCASGMAAGGRGQARQALRDFWTEFAVRVPLTLRPLVAPSLRQVAGFDCAPGLKAYLQASDVWSPYQLNPFNLNPLRTLLEEYVDFTAIQRARAPQVFINATSVRNGKIRVFRNAEITLDSVLASCCVPSLHHTIDIDGEPYWDGGYTGNPPVFPLIFESDCPDVLLILIQSLRRSDTPRSADQIRKRVHELAFNSAFLREMRAISFVRKQVQRRLSLGRVERRLKRLKFHLIYDHDLLSELQLGSQMQTDASFLAQLHARGQACAQVWLESSSAQVGRQSTVDLATLFD